MCHVLVQIKNKFNINSQPHVLCCVGHQNMPVLYSRVPASTYTTCTFMISHDNTSFPLHMFWPNFENEPTSNSQAYGEFCGGDDHLFLNYSTVKYTSVHTSLDTQVIPHGGLLSSFSGQPPSYLFGAKNSKLPCKLTLQPLHLALPHPFHCFIIILLNHPTWWSPALVLCSHP